MENKKTTPCKLTTLLPGCTPLQSALVVVKERSHIGLEYFCHGNASDRLALGAGGQVKTVVLDEVNKNWVPLATSIKNAIVANVLSANPNKLYSDFMNWLNSVNVGKMLNTIAHWVTGNWIKYAAAIIWIIIMCNSIISGNMTNVIVLLLLGYVANSLPIIGAIEPNGAVIPAVTMQLVRSNVICFLSYNIVDEYILVEVVDIAVLVVIAVVTGIAFGVVIGVLMSASIKFLVQYLDEVSFCDSMVPIGKELRLPWVIKVGCILPREPVFEHNYVTLNPNLTQT